MSFLDVLVRIYESSDARAALGTLAQAAGASLPVRWAAWADASGAVRVAWPDDSAVPSGASAGALLADAAGVVPLHDGEMACIPVRDADGRAGTLLMGGDAGGWDEAPAAWADAAAALGRVAAREARLRHAEEERDLLRQRAEESEALHVLGLAANRTLDPDEVLELVARFTRTLLGAHYVTVSTLEQGQIRTVASVGLRPGRPGDDPFAGKVAAAQKPLVMRQGERWNPGDFPYHAAQGTLVGLGVPLSLYGETFGALVIGYRRPFALASRDTRLALTLAGHAAVAISNARLHRALADRSRELERAYEELRWSAEAKERFFASLSHELRTPLNSVLGFQSLLLDGVVGPLAGDVRPYLERAYRATQGLLKLVDDVLDLSKIEAGKMTFVLDTIPARALVDEVVSSLEPIAARKGLLLSVEAAPPVSLRTDEDRVRQILLNLLSNAVKFTDAGGATVRVAVVEATGREGSSSRWVEFRVSDTGRGIPQQHQERIFHEFEQIRGTTSTGGTGLGLPISRKLARLLGGDLLVESVPGEGATFVLRLPADEAAAEVA
jgi:signal transduction histidine kinase